MNKSIEKLEPSIVWKHFSEICAIPHPSKHEAALRDYICAFAKKHNIECHTDEVGNVLLRKPATKGYENRMGLIMQSHIDMVPQKNSDKVFDFTKDPIEAYIDGEWVTANGTTLGADNGMGAAAALAVMESVNENHGLIEAFFTIDEEAGMTGAFGLKPGFLKGDILLNLDSEDEGELYVGCAGGSDIIAEMPFSCEAVPAGMTAVQIDVKGLKGGHSGMEAILQRANSNKILARIIYNLTKTFGARLNAINGGNMRNAIPREGNAVVVVPADKQKAAIDSIVEMGKEIAQEYIAVDENICVTAAAGPAVSCVMDMPSQNRIINAIYAVENGVVRMSDAMPGLVESSSNIGIVTTEEKAVKAIFLVRSSGRTQKRDLINRIVATFELAGAKVSVVDGYEGWQPNMNSPILKSMQQLYKDIWGVTPEIKAVHAGLECGIIGGTYPKMDMISFGPTIRFPHSPDEKVHIASVDKFYTLLLATIKNAPVK